MNEFSKWFPYNTSVQDDVRVRLFCFSYAGGSAAAFRPWIEPLAPRVQVLPVQLPGRERRLFEPCYRSVREIVDAFLERFAYLLKTIPYALFGHSLGGKIAFATATAIRNASLPSPVHLLPAGCIAPTLRDRSRPIHDANDDTFREELRRLGGTPSEILDNQELMALFMPMLRADYAAAETFECHAGPPLTCPITAMSGRLDVEVNSFELESWKDHTSSRFDYRIYEGGHFFIKDSQAALLRDIQEVLL